jgi:hypothetical protein
VFLPPQGRPTTFQTGQHTSDTTFLLSSIHLLQQPTSNAFHAFCRGSAADLDFSTFYVVRLPDSQLPDGYKPVGTFAAKGYDDATTSLNNNGPVFAIKSDDPTMFRTPSGYTKIYDDEVSVLPLPQSSVVAGVSLKEPNTCRGTPCACMTSHSFSRT